MTAAWRVKRRGSSASSGCSSANRSRRIWRITSACLASPAWPCCRPTRCRRSPTRPTSSSPRWSSPGVSAFGYAIPISLVIATLLAIVAFSYRQTIHAYPTGGGAYIVAKENIGANAGLIAAASLLVDYTLTVSVSISAGVLAITSAFPQLDAVSRRDVPGVPRAS